MRSVTSRNIPLHPGKYWITPGHLNTFLKVSVVSRTLRQMLGISHSMMYFVEGPVTSSIAKMQGPTSKHVDGHQVDEDDLLVPCVGAGTVLKGELQVLGGRLVVVLEHGLPTHVELVDDLVRARELLLEAAVLDHALQRVAVVDLVDLEVDLEELVDDVHHAPTL